MNDRTQPNPFRAPDKTEPAVKPDPKETAQESVHQVMPKSEVPKDLVPKPGASTPKPESVDSRSHLAAARGNDEVMSQPPTPLQPKPTDVRSKRANAPT